MQIGNEFSLSVLIARADVAQSLKNIFMDEGEQDPSERVEIMKTLVAEGVLMETSVLLYDQPEDEKRSEMTSCRKLTKVSLVAQ